MKDKEKLDLIGYPEWAEELSKAGYTYSGHVTNGSLSEMVKVVEKLIRAASVNAAQRPFKPTSVGSSPTRPTNTNDDNDLYRWMKWL